ncbi:uncharacterized protein LOC131876639 [Cryptomeria japonica]|uniref:uncharacterized protein LOC131876639 n=1 Tax=Cryptomeria japonica TaxID=3369 RepID=UPI0027DA5B2A|nr:uncharacterized protein LOC131876639 [Cryptomeria japonica]
MVAIEMLDKLKLKRLPHTTPYKVSWLSKGHHVLVDEQAWVDFEIGDYKDRVLCDILPMDACHLLLGRPWQFDVKAMHDGEKNSCLITKGGKEFQMDPLVEQGEERHVGSSVMLLSGEEFLKVLKHEGSQGCAIIMKPKEEVKATNKLVVPQEVQILLDRYKDIVVNEILDVLPLYRYVNHQIDLIPGENLPNKAAYKMTLTQNEEIAKQVQELHYKGLINKSLSPRVVPTMLAPKKDGKWRMCTDS